MSESPHTFQLSTESAEFYERTFVPALVAEWAEHLVDAAGLRPAQAVLDVACGTGVVARVVADRLAGSGRVVGVDLNQGMLAVARRVRPDIEWHRGDAAELPFPDAAFDVALCQAALMFFPDRVKALSEMARVVTDDGTVAVQVWGSLERQPGYRRFAEVAARHAGLRAMELVGSYFSLGEIEVVAGLFAEAGLAVSATRTRTGSVRFGSIEEFVSAEIESSPLVELVDDEIRRRIVEDCREALVDFLTEDGSTEIPIEGHLITARKR